VQKDLTLALLASYQSRLTNVLSKHLGRHVTTLNDAIKQLKHEGRAPPPGLSNKLRKIDYMAKFARHLTSGLLDSVLAQVAEELPGIDYDKANPDTTDNVKTKDQGMASYTAPDKEYVPPDPKQPTIRSVFDAQLAKEKKNEEEKSKWKAAFSDVLNEIVEKSKKKEMMKEVLSRLQKIHDTIDGYNSQMERNGITPIKIADAPSLTSHDREVPFVKRTEYQLLDAGAEQEHAVYVPPNSDRSGKTVADLAPKEFDSSDYKGQQEASKGILGLLETTKAAGAKKVRFTDASSYSHRDSKSKRHDKPGCRLPP